GSGLVISSEVEWLTGGLEPSETGNIYQQIEAAGVPAMLLDEYADRLEYHEPWHLDRDVSHLFRGNLDIAEADALLEERGFGHLKLVDNGRLHRKSEALKFETLQAYHLIPRAASKAGAVARHMQIRGYAPEEVIACGDSREDMEVASVVGEFFLMRNALDRDASLGEAVGRFNNVTVTEAGHGSGVYEAVVGTLARRS
ncbi:MAG: HAD hydrolase family protein, partial [Solirubrobacterales bacterium]